MPLRRPTLLAFLCLLPVAAQAAWVWVEGEQPASTNIRPHPWYSNQIRKDLLSGGAFLSHFDGAKPGLAEYTVNVPSAGAYSFWLRANPTASSLKYSINGGAPAAVSFSSVVGGIVNLASDNKPDLRFIGWVEVGKVNLRSGSNTVAFTMDSANNNHGAIDCFLFTNEPFIPSGTLKPDQLAAEATRVAESNKGWFPWNPPADKFTASPIDLRPLNEKFAGENGSILAKGDQFVHSGTGKPVRFWAVNGPAGKSPEELKLGARILAKYGVNLVRYHGSVFDKKTGRLTPDASAQRAAVVDALKAEGIYTLLSVYFPLWMDPEAGEGWREGYDGKKHPFALLYFEPEFQKLYRDWWKTILETRTASGAALKDDPALMGLELVNEDSFFFWTFNYANVPDAQMRKLEKLFGDWAAKKYGSLETALSQWGTRHQRDDLPQGRLGFRSHLEMFGKKTRRDQDTAAFLYEQQAGFYADTVAYLRGLGYKGMITAGNWTTANNDIFGPLEKLSYMSGDFIDRHGYFGTNRKGDNASWSLRDGMTYSDVSGLRFDSQKPGDAKAYANPVMDPMYNRRPSMISETTWDRPNRYRFEAPLVYAVYGALQDSDGIVHFAFDSLRWQVKPNYFMQPWTLMTPTQMGQFPATAFLYRQGLVKVGDLMADLPMKISDALALKGSGLVQAANLDELRKSDIAAPATGGSASRGIDPLIHFVGRTNVTIDEKGGAAQVKDLSRFIDRRAQTVTSSTDEVKLDYGKGILTLDAPAAQGVGGHLKDAGVVSLADLDIVSQQEVGNILVVALDGLPIATSSRILVQAMSEEKATGFSAGPAGQGVQRITSIGTDPWLVKELSGALRFKRADADKLKVTALDLNGYPVRQIGSAKQFSLLPDAPYYIIAP